MDSFLERIENIYVDLDSRGSEVVQNIQTFLNDNNSSIKIQFVSEEPLKGIKGDLSAEEFEKSKRNIFVTKFKGQFFKRCPGARPGLTCCNYFVLNLGSQCDMNCSYCYLQSFINSPLMKIYSNIDDALDELRAIGESASDVQLRVGTGEIIDSLSLDPMTLYSKKLVRFFKDYPKWQLEFKTKSSFVNQFVEEEHAGNVVCSWSVNPQYIIDAEEHLTAGLNERLSAARKCADRGFKVSFHIDPLIWHQNWKVNYTQLVDSITSLFRPDEVPYMSLGALRFQPHQRHLMRERFGMKSHVTSAELFPGKDGKLRYDQDLRNEMFQFIIQRFKEKSSNWNVFLCMESPETWLSSHEAMPKKVEGISNLFDHNVTRTVSHR